MIDLDSAIPREKVLQAARTFLQECNWVLEIDEGQFVSLPSDLELVIQTRAYISADAPDIFLGNHLEAVVMLGRDIIGDNWAPRYGFLRMYFDIAGRYISEDRYPARA